MSDTARDEAITGQHLALSTREEVHELRASIAGLTARVTVLERDHRDAQDNHRDRDRSARQMWMWVLGLLASIAITVISGMLALNGQIARLEERVDAMRHQLSQGQQPRWPQ